MQNHQQAIQNMIYLWETEMLSILHRSGILTDTEYHGICNIAKHQTGAKIIMSEP